MSPNDTEHNLGCALIVGLACVVFGSALTGFAAATVLWLVLA